MAAAAAADEGWIPVEERRVLAVDRDRPEGAPLELLLPLDEEPAALEDDDEPLSFLEDDEDGDDDDCPGIPGKPANPFMRLL